MSRRINTKTMGLMVRTVRAGKNIAIVQLENNSLREVNRFKLGMNVEDFTNCFGANTRFIFKSARQMREVSVPVRTLHFQITAFEGPSY
jgi:hypothetical protein